MAKAREMNAEKKTRFRTENPVATEVAMKKVAKRAEKKTRFRAENPVAIEEVVKRAQKKGEKFNGWGSDLSNQNRGNSLPEIQHLRHLLDIMERNINGTLTAQDAIDLRDNIDNWNEDAKKLGEMVTGLDIDIAALLEKDANTKEISISNSNVPEEECAEPASYTEEDGEEFNEQVSPFVENMVECVDDFIAKISSYESDEYLYEPQYIDAPCPTDYDSEVYEHPTKAKAKAACKEAVGDFIGDIQESYEEEKDNIVSYAADYFSGLEEALQEFVVEFLESYDEYASLECEGGAQEYVCRRKLELFGEKDMWEKANQINLQAKIKELEEKDFGIPSKKIFAVKEYFDHCTYDEEDGCYCYNLDEACDKMQSNVNDFLDKAGESFPNNVLKAYTDSIVAFCGELKSRLGEL